MKKELKRAGISKSGAGFTLLELLVSLSIFAVAAVIGVEAVLALNDAQQKVLSLRVTQDNLGYAIDTMGKEIRTGKNYHCVIPSDTFPFTSPIPPQDCPPPSRGGSYNGGAVFAFTNASLQNVVYCLAVTGGTTCSGPGTKTTLLKSVDGGSTFQALTSPDLVILNVLSFYVWGSAISDGVQPAVMIIFQGRAGVKMKTSSQVNIQTTISQRLLDS